MFAKKAIFAAIMTGSAVLAGCGDSGSSDNNTDNTTNPVVDQACSDLNGTMNSAGTQCTLKGTLAKSTTLDKDITYVLKGLVKVGDGDGQLASASQVQDAKDNGITLTIPAGTQIKGVEGAALIVTRGSKLIANGTAEAPVVFSSVDENMTGSGEWGGLVLQGFGVMNNCPETGVCNILGEGGVGYFGGDDNTDSSGSLSYVVITEGGAVLSEGNELNGVGFMAVGSGTTVDHLQVNENADDGVEFWGGAVSVTHLVITKAEDDSIDWDNGWVGGIQYALVKQNLTATDKKLFDKGLETDNYKYGMDNLPRSNPVIANVTLQLNPLTTAIHHKVGTAGRLFNVLVSGAAKCVDVDDAATAAQIDSGDLNYTNTVLDCTALVTSDSEVDGADYAQALIDSQTSSIVTDATGSLNADYKWSVGSEVSLDAATTIPGFDATNYVGAVEPAATSFWYAGWTVEGSL